MIEMVLGDYKKSNIKIITTVVIILLLVFGYTLPVIIIFSINLALEFIAVIYSFVLRKKLSLTLKELERQVKEESK